MNYILNASLICILWVRVDAANSTQKISKWLDSSGNAQTYKNVGLLAMEEVDWKWRPSGWVMEFGPSRKGYLGMRYLSEKKIVIWIRPEHSPADVAQTVVHELAHVFDDIYFTDKLRNEWLTARKLSSQTEWYPPRDCSDFSFGAGDFAESVSWMVQGGKGIFHSKLGPPPSKDQQKLIKKWLAILPQMAGK